MNWVHDLWVTHMDIIVLKKKNCCLFSFVFLKLLLLEAREAIQDKESIIEDKEHMIRLVTHEKEELTRENQVNLLNHAEI